MAEEVTVTTLLGNQGDPVEYTVADAGSIMKGTMMHISASPQTGSRATADGEFFAGVTAIEKKAGDGVTKIPLLTHFIGEFTAGTGTTTVGLPQKIGAGENRVIDADDDTVAKAAEVVGVSLETVADNARGAVLVNL